jgi:hypothetical protein
MKKPYTKPANEESKTDYYNTKSTSKKKNNSNPTAPKPTYPKYAKSTNTTT